MKLTVAVDVNVICRVLVLVTVAPAFTNSVEVVVSVVGLITVLIMVVVVGTSLVVVNVVDS